MTSPLAGNAGAPCTCFALRKLARSVSRLYDRHLAAAGLKTTQYSLLKCVMHEALPMARLAALLGAERTTLTRNLKPLQDAGWVAVQVGPDPRQRIVAITAAGRAKAAAARPAWRAAQHELECTLGRDALRALQRELDGAALRLTPGAPDASA